MSDTGIEWEQMTHDQRAVFISVLNEATPRLPKSIELNPDPVGDAMKVARLLKPSIQDEIDTSERISEIVEINDLLPDIERLHVTGLERGKSTGWAALDEWYTVRKREGGDIQRREFTTRTLYR